MTAKTLLPLTPFERMMIVDDRPGYRMVATLKLVFSGDVNLEILVDAYLAALGRHPLLRARLQRSKLGKLAWIFEPQFNFATELDQAQKLAPQLFDEACSADIQATIDAEIASIDLKSSPGFKCLVFDQGSLVQIHLLLPHACSDGMGLLGFVEDWLAGYDALLKGASANELSSHLRPIDAGLLKSRGKFPVRSESWGSWISETVFGFQLAARFGRNRPRALQSSQQQQTQQASASIENRFRQSESGSSEPTDLLKVVRRAAASKNVTVNDILIQALFESVNEFNASGDPKTRYRIMVPCDLRTESMQNISAANVMSFSFLDRRVTDIENSDDLLAGISEEMKYIRNTNASLYFIRSLQVASCIPFGISQVSKADQCLSTALISNLGDPTQLFHVSLPRVNRKICVGGATLESLEAIPPLRPLTRIGLVVNNYAGQLSLGFCYDRNALNENDIERFKADYITRLATASVGT